MDKLQELTQQLYQQGLSKGKQEAEELVGQAQKQAEALLEKARKEAAQIVEKAQKEAKAYQEKVEGDVRTAMQMALQSTREAIEKLIVARAVETPVADALQSEAFIKQLMEEMARRFCAETQGADLSVVLSESAKGGTLERFVQGELARAVGKGVEVSYSAKFAGGFQIGPKDGGYHIRMTDESFRKLIAAYLRPATKKALFG